MAHTDGSIQAVIGWSLTVSGFADGFMVIFSSHIHHSLLSRSPSAGLHIQFVNDSALTFDVSVRQLVCLQNDTVNMDSTHSQWCPNSYVISLITQAKSSTNMLQSQMSSLIDVNVFSKPTYTNYIVGDAKEGRLVVRYIDSVSQTCSLLKVVGAVHNL